MNRAKVIFGAYGPVVIDKSGRATPLRKLFPKPKPLTATDIAMRRKTFHPIDGAALTFLRAEMQESVEAT